MERVKGILNYEVEFENEDGDLESEEREIEVSTAELELVDTQGYERSMGTEFQYTYEGIITDEEGNDLEVEMEAWEYPEGSVSHVEVREK